MADFWDQLIDLLSAYQADPLTYLLVFFLFCMAAAILLPIPVEIFLVIDPMVPYPFKAIVMGLGKGAGALAVYYIGHEIDHIARKIARGALSKRLRRIAGVAMGGSPFLTRVAGSQRFRTMLAKLDKLLRDRRRSRGAMGWGWIRWLMRKSDAFVRRYGYPAMFAIMAIPGMVDTVPLYVFSILNREGELMTWRGFVLVNLAAGITRAAIIYMIFFAFGIPIFSPPETGA